MLKIFKAIAVGGYCALLVYLLKSEFLDNDDIIELNYVLRTPGTLKKILKEIKNMKTNKLTGEITNFKKPSRLPMDYKYILKWTQNFNRHNFDVFRNGQKSLYDFNCTYKNCYITNDKSVLVDIRRFDAIVFDAENTWDRHILPKISHQTHVFFAIESAVNDPVCDEQYDKFFHLTWTYKLDSNISSPYIIIKDKKNNVIGPKKNMNWITSMKPTTKEVRAKLKDKKKAVAWFISDCYLLHRLTIVKNLIKSLKDANLELDIYGTCGNFTCPKDRNEGCYKALQKTYYFYLAFESTISEDYVTENVMYPLLYYSVPIVFGGADYSRFLPPGSYIDARKLNSDEIVYLIKKAIQSPNIYQDYFRWHQHYVYTEPPKGAGICKLCELINSGNFSLLNNFRVWWNSDYKKICKIPFIKNPQFRL